MQPTCGHTGVPTANEFHAGKGNNKGTICIDCYREKDRERHRRYRGGAPRAKLKSAGHSTKRPSQPKASQDPLLVEAAEHDRKAREARAKYEAQHPEGYVYLVGESGPFRGQRFAVKIGKSANLPQYRLGGLQTGNPRKLVLLGYIETPDRHKAETELHARYAHLNILQEWFRPTAALMSEFGLLADGSPKSERKAA